MSLSTYQITTVVLAICLAFTLDALVYTCFLSRKLRAELRRQANLDAELRDALELRYGWVPPAPPSEDGEEGNQEDGGDGDDSDSDGEGDDGNASSVSY